MLEAADRPTGLLSTVTVIAGGQVVARFGYVPLYWAAAVLGLLATWCAWRVQRCQENAAA